MSSRGLSRSEQLARSSGIHLRHSINPNQRAAHAPDALHHIATLESRTSCHVHRPHMRTDELFHVKLAGFT